MRSAIPATILALALRSLAPAQTVPQFLPMQSAPSGSGTSAPTIPAIGDFNSDGIPDVAVGDTASHTVNILLGNGDGTFQTARLFAVGTNPQCVAVGDFNRDGKLDVVVANGDAGGTISLLLGNGDGTLRPAIAIGVVASPNWVAVGDFNGDGKLDIVVTGNNNLVVLLGNGFGGFSKLAPVTLLAPAQPPLIPTLPVAVADLNGDGRQDLLVTGVNNTLLLTGNGDGTFGVPVAVAPASPFLAATGDFNGDGRQDFAITQLGNTRSGAAAHLWIGLNTGGGTFGLTLAGGFTVPPTMGYDLFVENPVVADFNGDGKMDIAVKDIGSNVFLFQGNGDGTFQQNGIQAQISSFNNAGLVAADFDRNGSPDLLQSDLAAGAVYVLRNTRGNPPMLALLTLNPAVAQSGVTVAQGTVFLGSAAPASGAAVTLSIADQGAASLGAPTVFVSPGSSSATFQIFANPVAAQTSTQVSATYNGITVTGSLTVLPPPPPLVLSSLTLDRPGVFGSTLAPLNFAYGTVLLNTPPIGARVVVALTSSNPALAALSTPALTFGPGQTNNAFFVFAPQPVAHDTPVTISATYQGITKTMILTILKPQDSLTITKEQYDSVKKVIQVECASTQTSAQLGVWDTNTGQFLFWLSPTGGGKSSIQAAFPSATYPFPVPASITVRSTLGGTRSGIMAVK